MAELRFHFSRLPSGPWRVGADWWMVLDSSGQPVLRVETVNSAQAAASLAVLVNALPRLLGYSL